MDYDRDGNRVTKYTYVDNHSKGKDDYDGNDKN